MKRLPKNFFHFFLKLGFVGKIFLDKICTKDGGSICFFPPSDQKIVNLERSIEKIFLNKNLSQPSCMGEKE